MSLKKGEFDIDADKSGTYLVYAKNVRKLLFDGLIDTFSVYGKVMTVRDMGNRGVEIRYHEKESALQCYYELSDHPDFKVVLPNTFKKPEDIDLLLSNDLKDEAKIGFARRYSRKQVDNTKLTRYVCRKRKIIASPAFRCLMVALSTLNQAEQIINYRETLILEVKRRGINLNFQTGFEDEIENDAEENEIPQLVLPRDLYYFHITEPINAVDVLICSLPPWYEQTDAYKLVIPLVKDDLLQIDWYRMYPAGTKECSHPYGIIYLKSRRAAQILRHGADELVIDRHRITICLMENLEDILLDVKINV